MKTIQLEEQSIDVITSFYELNILQFEECLKICNTNYETEIDKFINLFSLLSGLSVDDIENLDLKSFSKLQQAFDINDFSEISKDLITSITIDDKVYKSKSDGKTYKFNVKQMLLLNSKLKLSPNNIVNDLAAIIFMPTDENGDIITDFSEAGISSRKELFATKINMDIMAPYLMLLTNYFLNKNEK